jgi:hypothetical protein
MVMQNFSPASGRSMGMERGCRQALAVLRLLPVLISSVLCSGDAQALGSRRIAFGSSYERIFEKIYLSALYGSPQATASGFGWCTDVVRQDPPSLYYPGAKDRRLDKFLPLETVDEAALAIMKEYKFWPFGAIPLALPN